MPLKAAAALSAAAFLLLSPAAAASAMKATGYWEGTTQSWALGIVVPNGAEVVGGPQLNWADVKNITALVKLPNITEPGGVTYLVLSTQGDDGAVLQVAAGIWPGSSVWSVYSWYITGIHTASISYRWIMNSSSPSMAPRDLVSISTSVGPGGWGMKILDINKSEVTRKNIPSQTLTKFESGDQEVFAFESYTRSTSTFREMQNASLLSLFVDGRRLAGGWYPYGGWDPAHSPLFEVGSSSAPAFISLGQGRDGQLAWGYDDQRTGAAWNTSFQPVMLAYLGVGTLVPIVFLLERRQSVAEGKGRG